MAGEPVMGAWLGVLSRAMATRTREPENGLRCAEFDAGENPETIDSTQLQPITEVEL